MPSTCWEQPISDHPVILFDGVCHLCNGLVQFIIRNDRSARFRFAALQSNFGQAFLSAHATSFDTFVLIDGDRHFTKSSAALRIAKRLDGLWPVVFALNVVPPTLRDWVYDQLAVHRYRWFGRRDTCMVPSAAVRDRFLD